MLAQSWTLVGASGSMSSALAVTFAVVVITAGCAVVLAVLLHRRGRDVSRQARRDPLTGLGNRTRLAEAAAAALRSMPPDGPGPALMLVDLDGFKEVNDTLGHAAGDEVLVQVATRLQEWASRYGMATRLGGDEFAVLVIDPAAAANPDIEAKRILAMLDAAMMHAGDLEIEVRASIGVAVAPHDGRTLSDLLQHADVAMYQAKRTRSGVARYDSVEDPHSMDRLEMLSRLRGALDSDELVVHYQPTITSGDGALAGFEALVRWQHPTLGLLQPDLFVPLAERTSLIHPLTRWVLLTALRQAAIWRHDGIEASMAVNVSSASLDRGLVGIVQEALALTRWPPDQLVLEITESALVDSPVAARAAVEAVRALGVRVSIDDFGAGYTSLAQLRGMPVQQLKIDRQFVTTLGVHQDDDTIVASIIDLGHRLGLQVVAEGVETLSSARRLVELGADELQGFLYSRPMPAAAVLDWAQEYQRRQEDPVPVG